MNIAQQIEFGNLLWDIGTECYLYQPNHKLLIVADLHLGKGDHFAHLGYPIPLYDATDTIHRLEQLINHFKPYTVILLGDSFHSSVSLKSLSDSIFYQLNHIVRQCESFIWLVGNHDSDLFLQGKLEGIFLSSFCLGNIILSHMPTAIDAYQIVGHYHPKMKVKIRGKVLKGKCYVKAEKLLIIPSFGTYTGGLYVSDPVFRKLFNPPNISCYLVHDCGVFKVK